MTPEQNEQDLQFLAIVTILSAICFVVGLMWVK